MTTSSSVSSSISDSVSGSISVGVLALQGAFIEHVYRLRELGVTAFEVRTQAELERADGLIIPGGESTAMGLVAERWNLVEPLRTWVHSGRPIWGTCAGMILLAEHAEGQKQGGQTLLGGLDVTVNRNYFGRQTDSFETELTVPALGDPPCHAVFIRAPAIVDVAPDVNVLASIEGKNGEQVAVAVRQGSILATAFHPELTHDLRWHRYFVDMIQEI